jgi:hypothetical protein
MKIAIITTIPLVAQGSSPMVMPDRPSQGVAHGGLVSHHMSITGGGGLGGSFGDGWRPDKDGAECLCFNSSVVDSNAWQGRARVAVEAS